MPRSTEVSSSLLSVPRAAMAALSLADRTFEAIVFDWDGTAVAGRSADAGEVRDRVEALCRAGMDLFIVSGTRLENIDGQLRARPRGPGALFLCLNRGSEVFRVDEHGAELVWA